MKVKCTVWRTEDVEIEIDDKFRKLAQAHPWEDKTIPEDMYAECIEIIQQIMEMPLGNEETEDGEYPSAYIECVVSAENGEIMLEW